MHQSDQTVEEIQQALGAIERAEQPQGRYDVAIDGKGRRDDIVRSAHAIDAVDHADAMREYEFEDGVYFAATRKTSVARGDFVLLVFGSIDDGRAMIWAAFRVYPGEEADLDALADDPSLAFAVLLKRYGHTYPDNQGRRVHFVPFLHVPQPPSLDQMAVTTAIAAALDVPLTPPGTEYEATAHNSFLIPSGPEPIRLLFPFVFDDHGYRADLRARGVV